MDLQPRNPKSLGKDSAAPLPHPLLGLADTRGSHTREWRWVELRQPRGKTNLFVSQHRPRRDRTHPREKLARHGASGFDPFPHPQKGLYPEAAFDRSPEDTRPVPRSLRIGGALHSASSLDAVLLTPLLATTDVPLVLQSSRGRMYLLIPSPEVLLPEASLSR